MTILVVLVPLALALGLAGLAAFLWSLRNGQYDDMDGAAVRILQDDDLYRDRPAESKFSPTGDATDSRAFSDQTASQT